VIDVPHHADDWSPDFWILRHCHHRSIAGHASPARNPNRRREKCAFP
jgi:hypothetical protein